MFGQSNFGAQAYLDVGVETGVRAASPHKLILMLFEGALTALATARQAMAASDIQRKGRALSQAITIVDNGLRASLDKSQGGDIANNLDALYRYISDRLLQANLNNDIGLIDEAARLLRELKGAWEQIGEKDGQAVTPLAPMPENRPDPLAPKQQRLVKA